jgi:hypothetical protein
MCPVRPIFALLVCGAALSLGGCAVAIRDATPVATAASKAAPPPMKRTSNPFGAPAAGKERDARERSAAMPRGSTTRERQLELKRIYDETYARTYAALTAPSKSPVNRPPAVVAQSSVPAPAVIASQESSSVVFTPSRSSEIPLSPATTPNAVWLKWFLTTVTSLFGISLFKIQVNLRAVWRRLCGDVSSEKVLTVTIEPGVSVGLHC